MRAEIVQQMIQRQRAYFAKGKTQAPENRRRALQALEQTLKRREKDIAAALHQDLGKSEGESYLSELGMVYSELHYQLRHLGRFSREKRVATPLAQAVSRSSV